MSYTPHSSSSVDQRIWFLSAVILYETQWANCIKHSYIICYLTHVTLWIQRMRRKTDRAHKVREEIEGRESQRIKNRNLSFPCLCFVPPGILWLVKNVLYIWRVESRDPGRVHESERIIISKRGREREWGREKEREEEGRRREKETSVWCESDSDERRRRAPRLFSSRLYLADRSRSGWV